MAKMLIIPLTNKQTWLTIVLKHYGAYFKCERYHLLISFPWLVELDDANCSKMLDDRAVWLKHRSFISYAILLYLKLANKCNLSTCYRKVWNVFANWGRTIVLWKMSSAWLLNRGVNQNWNWVNKFALVKHQRWNI